MRREHYENGVLVYSEDTRTVSTTAKNRIAQIKKECADAIAGTGIGWMVEREVSGGSQVPQAVKDQCASYRTRSNELEAQIAAIISGATGDDDKDACDLIEKLVW